MKTPNAFIAESSRLSTPFFLRCYNKILRLLSPALLSLCRETQILIRRTTAKLSTTIGETDPRIYSGGVRFPVLHADRELFCPDIERSLAKATNRSSFFSDACPPGSSVLEIGPLHAPICRRPDSNVKYIDAFTTEELREHYASDPNVDSAAIVDVHYVWRGEPYGELIGERFDCVVTSHNIEHMPCLVDFLGNLESVLKPGGRVYLAIPDKRYCFDHYKSESSISDVVDAFILGKKKLPPSALVRQALLVTHNESRRHWMGDHGKPACLSPEDFAVRLKRMAGVVSESAMPADAPAFLENKEGGDGSAGLQALRTLYNLDGSVHTGDQHAWVFTPGSFAEIVFLLNHLGLTKLFVDRLHPTAYGSHEFYAVLRKP